MKLRDLDAHFIGKWTKNSYRRLPGIHRAQGVVFQCPKCAEGLEQGEEDGRRFYRGAHYIICWFRNPRGAKPVPDDADPKPGRWWAEGTCIDDLSFTLGDPPIKNSVLLLGGCKWHGFVENGEAA